MEVLFEYLKPIKILVLLTLLYALICLKWKNSTHRYLIIILIICFVTELTNCILIVNHQSIGLAVTISVICHHTIWLLLLSNNNNIKNLSRIAIMAFLLFAIINLFYLEGTKSFNYLTFVLGAFIYILCFIYHSIFELRHENLPLFLSNKYLLTFAPVIFFFGMSFMFAFKSKNITSTMLLPHIKLYDFVIYYVNIIYYVLVNLYIYRDKTTRNTA